jgi:hypothetical protein
MILFVCIITFGGERKRREGKKRKKKGGRGRKRKRRKGRNVTFLDPYLNAK